MEFIIRIANRDILIHSVYQGIYRICRAYQMEGDTAPDIEIHTDENMIDAEAERIIQTDGKMVSEKAAENLLIHRLISEELLSFDTLLMHGAVIAAGGAAHMFAARSGTGKTTHIQKWLDYAEDAFVVNGDKPFVLVNQEGAFACGSPWSGKENLGTNAIVPLRSIVFMERSGENHMEPASFMEIFPLLLTQTYQPEDPDKMRKTLKLLNRLKDCVSFYRFYFNNYQPDAFQIAYSALTGRATDFKEEIKMKKYRR